MTRSYLVGVPVGLIGVGLVSWVLVDASSVASTLRLNALMDEAAVALIGLAFAGACFASAAALLRRPGGKAHVR